MNTIPSNLKELQTLNTPQYRTLHELFERISHAQPELNLAILDFIESLDRSHQHQFINILYQLEAGK